MFKAKYMVMVLALGVILGIGAAGAQAGFFDDLAKKAEKMMGDQGFKTLKNSGEAVGEWGGMPLVNTNGKNFKTKLTGQAGGFGKFAKIIDRQKDVKWWKTGEMWNASHQRSADLHQGAENDVYYVFEAQEGKVVLKDIVIRNRHQGLADDGTTFNEWEIAEQVERMVKKGGGK